jgi:hypothetical protein
MKKIITNISALGVLLLGLSACDDFFEDKIADPTNPTTVSPDLLLSNLEVATFANFGGQLARQTQVMTQHIAGTSAGSQTVQIANYNITELTNENEWGVIYTGTLLTGKTLLDEFGADNPTYAGITRILMAMNLASATDLWGDVPYVDALNGADGVLSPTYDSQQDLYDPANASSIFGLLDQAIANLNEPASSNSFFPAADDFIYGGDAAAWIALANSLKARYYNHLSAIDPGGSATNALAAINAGSFSSSADNAYMIFGSNGNEQNQWYAYNQQRGDYIKMGEYFVELLKTNSDPRLSFFASPLTGGDYVGTPKDDVDSINTSNVGTYLNSLTAQIPLMSYTELKFIEAEAMLRSGDPQAATSYNEAVIASVTEVTGMAPDAAFIAAYASETPITITLETIMNQKYIAMFGQIEAYNDFRRTDFPSDILPNPSGNISTIPVRLIYPQNERLYNTNFPGTEPLIQPVYWDQ